QRRGGIDEVAQGQTFPDRIADQAGIESVANAHQSGLLFHESESFEIAEPVCRPVLHEPVDFEVPKIDLYPRVNDVLGAAIEQLVRRDWLDDAAFVLRAVVAEGGGAIKLTQQRRAST